MKLIELHILQSFPVSCLNRDDVGAPKTATFGGAPRARVSSQCLKRAVRELAQDMSPALFAGNRSRLIIEPLAKRLQKHGITEAEATKIAKQVGDHLAKLDDAAEKRGTLKVKTLMFLSPSEVDAIAKALAEIVKKDPKAKELEKAVAKACKSAALKDAADIAIFGRMVASDHSLTIEGAGLFSHALSTHKAHNDIDFFSAVDDLQPQEEAGAGMTGTLEFNSATYYRYAALNLDLLFYQKNKDGEPAANLGCFAGEEHKSTRRDIVDAFIRGTVLAVPGARKNSMNAHTLPGYVLGLVKDHGQPLQLVNAFEKPVSSKNGLMDASVAALQEHHKQLKETWGIMPALEVAIPDKPLDQFCAEILRHV
jgi:CRISPR system Cascade subunit CasC